MAPSANDSLRRTLDTFSVPKEASDRPYLESVLRRLGYTESEIRAYLGDAPAAAAPTTDETPAATSGERVVEVEYTGPGLREFRLAQPVTAEEYALAQQQSGPSIEMESGPSMEEVERALAEGNLQDDFGDFTPPEAPPAEETPPNELDLAAQAAADAAAGVTPPADPNAAPQSLDLPAGEAPPALETSETSKAPGLDAEEGEALVEFASVPMSEAVVEPVDMEQEAQRLKDEGWQVETKTGDFDGPEMAPEEQPAPVVELEPAPVVEPEQAWADESAEDGFTYNDWTLYRKDDDGPTPQSIYFFSKGRPEGASPATVPEGYEVAENPETGRPFLRRAGAESWPDTGPVESAGVGAGAQIQQGRKRVRVVRVRAGSREEAMQKLQQEGRTIVGSLAIDVERRVKE
jgi:hypothetical protein